MEEAGIVHGHHFFLMPPSAARDVLRECIKHLALRYGGPFFEPHLTLLARLPQPESELRAIGEQAAHVPAPVIRFNEARTGPEFFKCCYLSVELTAELTALNGALARAVGDTRAFDPHISLAYGTYDADTLSRMKADADAFFAEHPIIEGPAASFGLWKTEGSAKEWKLVADFPFGE